MIYDHLACGHCGCEAIFGQEFYDGQGAEVGCVTCGFPGHVSCDSETEPWWAESEEAGAMCKNAECTECADARKAAP